MDIGKPVRIHNIPDPHRREIRRIDWEENPMRITRIKEHPNREATPIKIDWEPKEQPIPVPDWPTKKPVEVETDG